MDHKTVDRALLLGYVVLIVLAIAFVKAAVAPIAIFGAAAVTAWFSVARPTLKAKERERLRLEDERRHRFD